MRPALLHGMEAAKGRFQERRLSRRCRKQAAAWVSLLASATCLLLIPFSNFPVAIAAEKKAVNDTCSYQPRDDLGRCPILKYDIVVSENDRDCRAVADALNDAPAGPDKLFSDRVFIRWNTAIGAKLHDPIKSPSIDLPGPIWVIAPIFNDGKRFAVERTRSEAGLNLVLFRDARGYTDFLKTGKGPLADWYPSPLDDATTTGNIGFPLLQKSFFGSRRWAGTRALRNAVNELHWAEINDTVYLVGRIYYHEIVYVVKFKPDQTFDDACYLASTRWWDSDNDGNLTEREGVR